MVYQQVYWVMETKKILIDWVLVCVYSILCPTGQLVYLVYWFISPLFIFSCILSINQINRFISPCVISLDNGIVSGLLVYLVYWFISPLFFFMRSLNKPNKTVYFSMRSLTGQWDSVRFIGLFGLSVYFSTVYFSMGFLNKGSPTKNSAKGIRALPV